MFKLEIGLIDEDKLNIDKNFLDLDLKQKNMQKSSFKRTISI